MSKLYWNSTTTTATATSGLTRNEYKIVVLEDGTFDVYVNEALVTNVPNQVQAVFICEDHEVAIDDQKFS